MPSPLYVAFVWHMHQPYYKDTETGQYTLPWVRLHAVKDYLHIAQVISDFPAIHQTINVVPSLAEQLQDYASGLAIDQALAVSQRVTKPSLELSDRDRAQILKEFFSINWDRFVWPYPRYAQLARLREAANGDTNLFADPFWRDLVAWFNLAWIDPSTRQRSDRLRELQGKGRDFSPSDVAVILDEHRALCGQVIPRYRELAESGQVELAVSPYYHPILPLLVDTSSAREASPRLPPPHLRFNAPSDARTQIADAIASHQQTFGREPVGMWPPEGAISQAAIELIGTFPGIRWIASDEHVLARSLGVGFERDSYGHLRDPRPLCQPYLPRDTGPVVFFRDQVLSDRIGFVYQYWDSRAAADDLVERLLQVGRTLDENSAPRGLPPIISIILDGENCWEAYPNNGDDFLRFLFDRLRRETTLKTVTPNEYLALNPDIATRGRRLGRVIAASWIGSSLETWIGESDQNRAWEYLALARNRLARWERETPNADPRHREQAWRALRVAEGSDWFWWYYSRNRIDGDQTFDQQFREELSNVYRAIGVAVPEWLTRPVAGQPPPRYREVDGPMVIDQLTGDREAGSGWRSAGYVEPETSTGAMQVGSRAFRRFYFGYDATSVYFRLELMARMEPSELSVYVGSGPDVAPRSSGAAPATSLHDASFVDLGNAFEWRIDLPASPGGRAQLRQLSEGGTWTSLGPTGDAVVGESAFELRIDRSALRLQNGVVLHAVAGVRRDETVVEVVPTSGAAEFRLGDDSPSPDGRPAPRGDRYAPSEAHS